MSVSTITLSPSNPAGLAASVQEQASASAMFIGAVPDEWELYSDRAEDYTIGSPIGFGASSIVYAATYHPPSTSDTSRVNKSIPCALKVLDLDSLPPRALHLLQRETTLMSLSKHPNVLRVRGSWIDGHKLYIAMRLMKKGSAADVMRYGWPGGMEEDVVRCILRQALKGLSYLHTNGFIHRDIKAANLLIDDDGTVLLGDLGVAADLAEDTSHIPSSSTATSLYTLSTSTGFGPSPSAPALSVRPNSTKRMGIDENKPRIGKRKSFVGTPCWMAPELIQGKQYDSKADIWSFGITALELSQGRPPRSRESPQRVLLRTIQEEPPTLNRDGGVHKYSRAFKEMVDSCLVKDPAKRPTAEELLQTPFFKAAKKKSYLINTILRELPPLTLRQERRVVQPILSANSIDSWDFGATLNSPTTSVYRRRILEEYVSAEDEQLRMAGIPFEMDDMRSKLNSKHRHRQFSSVVPEADDLSDFDEDSQAPSSPSTSQSSFFSSDDTPSLGSSPPESSAPSSYASASNLDQRIRINQKDSGMYSINSAGGNHRAEHSVVGVKHVPPSPVTPGRGGLKDGSGSTPTLWHKLKSNVKRSASVKTFNSDGYDGSPRSKDKTKGATLSKRSLLSRSTTRSSLAAAATRCEGK